MTKRQKQKLIKGILTVVCLGILALLWYFIMPMLNEPEEPREVPDGVAEIHFIDVGQGDATLIRVGEKNILIDTGEKDAQDALLAYLDGQGVKELEYFVVTFLLELVLFVDWLQLCFSVPMSILQLEFYPIE